jgi:hypothetical protein
MARVSPDQLLPEGPDSSPTTSPAETGGADDARIARWMEQAGAHQTRAVAWLRRARDPAAGPLPLGQRRELLMRALEHILTARRLLLRAHKETQDAELLALLNSHLERLSSTAASTERLLHELDAAQR